MNLYTIGFTQKSAETFFETIKNNNITLLLDIRLNNSSQLAGFAKGRDLDYFLNKICKCNYEYGELYAPTKDLLDEYKKKKISWQEYENEYRRIMINRGAVEDFINKYLHKSHICLLCSEATAHYCHRRIFSELLQEKIPNLKVIHL